MGGKQSSVHTPLKQELIVVIFILHVSGRKQRQHNRNSAPSRIAIHSAYESIFHFFHFAFFFSSNAIQVIMTFIKGVVWPLYGRDLL